MQLSDSKKKLLRLLSSGQFRSGNFLGTQLGISRTSVWKQINALAELGLEVDAVPGRGYRLACALELLDECLIRSRLGEEVNRRIGAFFIHDRIDSTNRFLGEVLLSPQLNGAVCLAESQSAGRGRIGRTWVSPFGNNIYMSLAWHFEAGPANLSGLSLAVGVAVIRALRATGVSGLGLKWPNDILWEQRKLGGILIELSGDAQGPCKAIIGLGLNGEIWPEQGAAIGQEWVDLATIAKQERPERNRLIAALLNEMLPVVANFDQSGFGPFLAEWQAADCLRGKQVVLYLGNYTIEGRVAGIDEQGMIQLVSGNGELRSYASGEVSFHPNRVGE